MKTELRILSKDTKDGRNGSNYRVFRTIRRT